MEYLDGENGEDELYERYGRGDVNYPDTFTVVPSGEISSIDDLEKYIRQRAEERKYREDRTIIPDVMMEATIPIVCRSFINP